MNNDSDSADFGHVLRSVWRKRWRILGLGLLCAVLFYGLASRQTEVFTTSTTLMLESRERQVLSGQDQVVSDLKLSTPIIDSEVTILQSPAKMEAVVRQLGVERFASIDPTLAEPGLIETFMSNFRSGEPAEPERPSLVSPEQRQINRIVETLLSGLSVGRVGESYVIRIWMQSSDPELAALVPNTLTQIYIDSQIRDRQIVAETATSWISDQVDARRDELARAEKAVDDYKREQLETLGASVNVLEQQLTEMNEQLANARSERASETARLQQIEEMLAADGPLAVADTQDRPFLNKLREERDSLMRRDGRFSETLGENNRLRQDLATEVAEIDSSITSEVNNILQTHRNEIAVLTSREAALREDVTNIESRLSDISASSLELRQLEREMEAARTSYQELSERLGETRAQVDLQRAEAKVISPAGIPETPSAPQKSMMAAFGATLGVTGAIVFFLTKELSSSGFARSEDLERLSGLKVLTILPQGNFRRPLDVLNMLMDNSYSIYAERIRQLRIYLSSSRSPDDRSSHSILLLSSLPDEGKTTTALALAQTYAETGAKTILVDLDWRRATLERELADTVLAISDADAAAAAAKGDRQDRSGIKFDLFDLNLPRPVNPDEFTKSKITWTINKLKRHYDVVIIDASPVLAVSDSLSIAAAVDDVIYLVRWRQTARKSVQYGLSSLEKMGVRPTGLVLTMAETHDEPEQYASNYS